MSLVGLAGSGKSTVGAVLARRWGFGFLDLDVEVERRAGKPVRRVFEEDGEPAFRALERDALLEAAARDRVVLAPGGGAPCQAGAMEALLEAGPVVWLRGRPETLASRIEAGRIGAAGDRPLLGRGRTAALTALAGQLVSREPVYARADLAVDVDDLGPEEVADAVAVAVGAPDPESLHVSLGDRSYPIRFTRDLPGPLVAREASRVLGRSDAAVLVVTDTQVGPLYAGGVVDALERRGFRVASFEIAAGEGSKTLDTVSAVADRALAHGVGRRDLLVALGGGVAGDVAGFAASILHRGVRFLQVPTSLLAQVDSSVGGKTGVNHARGKNLLGSFWQPSSVVTSAAVLGTLPDRERRSGLAEALKHGLLGDAALVSWISEHAAGLRDLDPEPTLELVRACCRIKAAVVESDEREAGPRASLNLGHTFGHAFERATGYGVLTHGEAVALGMVLAARLSEALGVAAAGLEAEVRGLLRALGLPDDPEAPGLPALAELIENARSDKKAQGDRVRFVLLPEIGRTSISTLTWTEIQGALEGAAP